MATNQSQSVQTSNTIISLAQSLNQLYQQIRVVNEQWGDNASANQVNAFPTCAQNVDGSLGAADSVPNVAHPIDTRVLTGLSRATSANSIASMLTVLNNIKTYVEGGAVAATPGVRAILNNATGG